MNTLEQSTESKDLIDPVTSKSSGKPQDELVLLSHCVSLGSETFMQGTWLRTERGTPPHPKNRKYNFVWLINVYTSGRLDARLAFIVNAICKAVVMMVAGSCSPTDL